MVKRHICVCVYVFVFVCVSTVSFLSGFIVLSATMQPHTTGSFFASSS